MTCCTAHRAGRCVPTSWGSSRVSRFRGACDGLRGLVSPAAGWRGCCRRARPRAAGDRSEPTDRPGGARALPADPRAAGVSRTGGAGHEHPSFFPALIQGGTSVRAGACARREADRCDGPLPDRAARRGADHRAGGRARRSRSPCRRTCPGRTGCRVRRPPRAVRWHVEHRVLLHGDRTVVFR